MDEAVRSNALEAQVYRDLLNSTDPNIRTMAGVGMLQAGQPRRGKAGLQGWLGEVQGNPIYPVLSKYMTTPQVTGYEDVPQVTRPEQAGYLPTTPPGVAPAAQTTTETTTPGAPPPTPVSPTPRWFDAGLTTGQQPPEPQLPPGSVSTHVEPELESILKTRSVPPAPDLETVGRAMAPEPLVTHDRRAIWGLPQAFPTTEDIAIRAVRAKNLGDYEGMVDIFRRSGSQNPEQDAADLFVSERRRGAGIHEGDARQLADGRWVQDLYDNSGRIVSTIPASPKGFGAGGNVQPRDAIAFRMFGKQGEDPKLTIRRLTPTQMGRVIEEEANQKAITGAEVALRRAQVMADAPLSNQAKSQLIEALNTKWQKVQQPIREMQRQFQLMETGLKRFADPVNPDKIGGSQAVLVTFQKMLDPISVVRESEYARTPEGLGLLQRLEGGYERLKAGGAGVPTDEMAAIVETGRQFLAGMQGWNDIERQRIEDRAAQNGIDPGYIFGGGVAAPPPTPTPTPTPRPTPTPPGAPTAAPTPSSDWTMVNGVLHYKGKPY
jgi:hypothetical protein